MPKKSYSDDTPYEPEFWEMMKNRMKMGRHRYGPLDERNVIKYDIIKSLKKRLRAYEESGNTEFLVDVANFAMMEYLFPMHPDAHFKATDHSESPGSVLA